jgi:hypothetical protein
MCGILGGLLAACILSYSEISPFVVFAALSAAIIVFAVRPESRSNLVKLVLISALLAVLFLNWEIIRSIPAVIFQANAFVGSAVDWPVIKFLGFAFGVYFTISAGGGDWPFGSAGVGLAVLLGLLILIAGVCWKLPRMHRTTMLPLICFAAACALAFAYFRYAVPSPFPVGTGQSWNQFKLVNWVFPAIASFIALAFASVAIRVRAGYAVAMLMLVVGWGLIDNYNSSEARVREVVAELASRAPIFQTLLDLRRRVKGTISDGDVVYLQLKATPNLRALVTYILYDVNVASNWIGDAIGNHLPGDRVVARVDASKYAIGLEAGVPSDLKERELWRVGSLAMLLSRDIDPQIRIANVENANPRETSGGVWWYWVKDKIEFSFERGENTVSADHVISFQYLVLNGGNLLVEAVGENGMATFDAPQTKGLSDFEQVVPASFGRIRRIVLTGSGEPVRLNQNDPRLARFQVLNLALRPRGGDAH